MLTLLDLYFSLYAFLGIYEFIEVIKAMKEKRKIISTNYEEESEMSKEEMNKQETNKDSINAKDLLIGTLIGGIVGATTALFLAPKSGRELREDITDQAAQLKERRDLWKLQATEFSNDLAESAKDKTNQLTKAITDQTQQVIDKVKQLREKNGDVSLELQEQVQDIISEAATAIENGTDDMTDAVKKRLEDTKAALEDVEKK
jgi:gas vesicle protein